MRRWLLFAVLAVTCLGWVGAEEPNAPASTEPQSWEGQASDKLVAVWGKPTKIKKDRSGGQVLVYRLRLLDNHIVGKFQVVCGDVGEGSPGVDVGGLGLLGDELMRNRGSRAAVATLKVRFYVDNEGTVYREEYAPVKWKNLK